MHTPLQKLDQSTTTGSDLQLTHGVRLGELFSPEISQHHFSMFTVGTIPYTLTNIMPVFGTPNFEIPRGHCPFYLSAPPVITSFLHMGYSYHLLNITSLRSNLSAPKILNKLWRVSVPMCEKLPHSNYNGVNNAPTSIFTYLPHTKTITRKNPTNTARETEHNIKMKRHLHCVVCLTLLPLCS